MSNKTYQLSTLPSSANPTGIIVSGLSSKQLYDWLRSHFHSYDTFYGALQSRLWSHDIEYGTARFKVEPDRYFPSGNVFIKLER